MGFLHFGGFGVHTPATAKPTEAAVSKMESFMAAKSDGSKTKI